MFGIPFLLGAAVGLATALETASQPSRSQIREGRILAEDSKALLLEVVDF